MSITKQIGPRDTSKLQSAAEDALLGPKDKEAIDRLLHRLSKLFNIEPNNLTEKSMSKKKKKMLMMMFGVMKKTRWK